ncbi:flagellar hook-length control protein FliK [Salipiger sp. 1_MG-2023]|uniref:flagellar hook-length control protein FliK n=1 Tax=Salipiger sp. 1_MG-2023 TaxID=3062665 RepID=UPI0026E30501|nr:flagellar hook-length control protein FliK [Salipiger sp. 1_MG-2023]MDO6586258.1 flagellar hook-length control protein FliK [Salipiger sp. 1_MG-2023]
MLSELSGLFGLLQAPKDKQSGAEGALDELIFDDVYKEVTPDSELETNVEGEPAPPTEEPAATAMADSEDAKDAGQDEDGQSTDTSDELIPEGVQVVEGQSNADAIEATQEPPVDHVDAIEVETKVAINGHVTIKPDGSPAERGAPKPVTFAKHTGATSTSSQSKVHDDMSDPVATVVQTEEPSAEVAETPTAPSDAKAALALTASSLTPDVTRQPEIVADRLVMRQAEQKAGAVTPLSYTQVPAGKDAVRSSNLGGRHSEKVTQEPSGAMQKGVHRPANSITGGPNPERIDVEVSGAGSATEASVKEGVIAQHVFVASQKPSRAGKTREPILSGQVSSIPRPQVEGSSLVDSSISARVQAPSQDVPKAIERGRPIWRSALAIQRSAGRNLASPAYQSGISTQGGMTNRAESSANGTSVRQATSTSGMAITAHHDAAQGRSDVNAEPTIAAKADVDVNSGSSKAEAVVQRVPGSSVQKAAQVESLPVQGIPSQEMTHATTSEPVTASANDAGSFVDIMSSAVSSNIPTNSAGTTLRSALFPDGEAVSLAVPQAAQRSPSPGPEFPEMAPSWDATETRFAVIADGDADSEQIVGSPSAERSARSNHVFKPEPLLRDTQNTPIAGSDRMTPIDPIHISTLKGSAPTQAQPSITSHAPSSRPSVMEGPAATGAKNISEVFEGGVTSATGSNQAVSAASTAASSVASIPDKAVATFREIPAKVPVLTGDTSIQLTRAAASPDISPIDVKSDSDEAPAASNAQTPPVFRSSRAAAHSDTVSVGTGSRPSIDLPSTSPAGDSVVGQMDPSELSDDKVLPGDAIGVTSGDIRSASASMHAASPPSARAEHTSAVMRQIADAATTGTPNSDGSIELQLRPDELGLMRFKMMHGEHGMTMHISAERPETLDMLRRNIDQLSRYLDELGYESTSFTFGDGHTGSNPGGGRAMPVTAQDVPQLTDSPDTAPPLSIASGGLDLRF